MSHKQKNKINECLKIVLKILLIGVLATICRIVGQFLIPSGESSVLGPSVFALNGTMPMVFTLYGILAYSLIASLFLLVRRQLTGNRVVQGLKFGIACCLIWIVYLWEPLPHVQLPLDRITYPLIDSAALLVMGVLVGLLLGETKPEVTKKSQASDSVALIIIALCFVVGRLIQYLVFDIYSLFDTKMLETIWWCAIVGLTVAGVMVWLNQYVRQNNRVTNALIVGGLLFGLDLTLFNFFMPLIFTHELIPDLILRTVIDLTAVTIGCLFLDPRKWKAKPQRRSK